MKILFIPHSCIPFNAHTLDNRPLGGVETGVINLSKELSDLGHDVFVATAEVNPPLSVPLYIPLKSLSDLGSVDVLIAVRNWEPILYQISASIKILWTGDSYDQPQNIGIGDLRLQQKIDALCCVSEWHKDSLCSSSGFPLNKTYVLKNGVNKNLFSNTSIKRVPKRLIYSSTPYRGLKHLPRIFSEVLSLHPDATLHVCSGYDVYAGAGDYPKEVLEEFEKISEELRKIPAVKLIGNVAQRILAQEFQEASILSYPNTFEETSCITVLEAQMAQCIPVTTALGALPETVGNTGICIKGVPGSDSYNAEFIKVIDNIFRNHELEVSLRDACKSKSLESDWSSIASNFSNFLTQYKN